MKGLLNHVDWEESIKAGLGALWFSPLLVINMAGTAKAGWFMVFCGLLVFVGWSLIQMLVGWNKYDRAPEKPLPTGDHVLWSNDDIPTMPERELAEFRAKVKARNISKRAGRKIQDAE